MNTTSRRRIQNPSRNGSATPFIVMAVIALCLVGFGAYYAIKMRKTTSMIEPVLSEVTRGEFVSQVIDQGEVQSSENVEIRCEVRARNGSMTVLTVTQEGSLVEPGDFLVQLDSTAFEKELEQQNIALVNAETRVIQAESGFKSAEATLKEYLEGTLAEQRLTIENEINDARAAIATAEQGVQQAEDTLGHSQKLQAKGFITDQALESARFDVTKANLDLTKGHNSLALAKKKLEVLENITREKNVIQYEADIKAARVQWDSEEKALVVEKEKKAEIEEMIAKCKITVPENVSGQVVFAKESSRGGNDWILEEGTSVRENQVLIRLPDPDQMEVKALINEQSITQIEVGMPCTVQVDALNDITLKGIVTKVNQYAESSGWMSSSVRKYAVLVKIFDPPPALKPGMNASVTIQVQYEDDVLLAPIQCVYAVGDKKYCLAKVGDRFKTLEITINGDNSQVVYITGGVEQGATLVMNPGAYKDLMDLPEIEMESKIELPDGSQAEIDAAKQAADQDAASGGPGAGRGNREGRGGAGGPGGRQGGRAGGPGGRAGGGGRPGGGGAGGASGFSMPNSGAELISSKDQDGDGKLTKDEAGSPYNYFFDQVDTDSDGFLSESELDTSIRNMKKRMQGGGGFGGGGPR